MNRAFPFLCITTGVALSAAVLAAPAPEVSNGSRAIQKPAFLLLAATLPQSQAAANAALGQITGPLRRTYPGLRSLPGTVRAPNPTNSSAAMQDQGTNLAPVYRITTNADGQTILSNVSSLNIANQAQTARSWTNHSNVTPLQLQNISRIDVALHNFELPGRDRSVQCQAMIATLHDGLVVPSDSRPPNDAVAQLGSSLAAVVPTLNLTGQQRRQLAIDLNMALNSANLAPAEAQRVSANARSLLEESAVRNPKGVAELSQSIEKVVSLVQEQVASRGNGRPGEGAPARATQAGQAGGTQTGTGGGGSPLK